MVSEMKLIISENEKVIHTLTKEINTQSLVKSIEDFRQEANKKLTNMIEELCGAGDVSMEDEEDDVSDEEDEDTSTIPKKRKR